MSIVSLLYYCFTCFFPSSYVVHLGPSFEKNDRGERKVLDSLLIVTIATAIIILRLPSCWLFGTA